MSKLNEQDHVPTILTRLDVLILRLGAYPKTRELVPPLRAVRGSLVAADGVWNEAVVERLAASLELAFLDGEVDLAWMDLSRDVHARVRGDRKAALWIGLYTEAPSETVDGTMTDHQTRNVERVIQIINDQDAYKDFRPQAQRLAAAQAEAVEGEKRYRAALAKEAAAAHQRDLVAHEARRVHNRVKPELELLFEDAPRMVRRFWG